MTYRDNRPLDDDTYVQQPVQQPVQQGVYPATGYPAGGGGSQVNVNAGGGGGYVAAYSPGPLYYARRVVALLFSILQVLIILRIILLALGANQDNGLVNFIYGVTEPFVAPFRGIFGIDQVSPIGQSVLDVAALVALIGYFLIELLILAILRIADRNTTAAA